MFGEPLLAHPAERRGVQAARQPHSWDGHDRDQHDDDTKGKQHVVLARNQVPSSFNNPDTSAGQLSVRLCTWGCASARAPRRRPA